MTSCLVINCPKLPSPLVVVKERPQVEAVIVWRVGLGVVRGRQHGHLVPVDGVATVKMLHLSCHLFRGAVLAPGLRQLAEHGEGAAVQLLAQTAVLTQLVVRHAHVLLVGLGNFLTNQRFKFCCGRSTNDLLQDGQIEPRNEFKIIAG